MIVQSMICPDMLVNQASTSPPQFPGPEGGTLDSALTELLTSLHEGGARVEPIPGESLPYVVPPESTMDEPLCPALVAASWEEPLVPRVNIRVKGDVL